jgi:hypothetical protein
MADAASRGPLQAARGEEAQLEMRASDADRDQAADAGIAAVDHADVAARFSKVIRAGRWVAGRRTRLTARFGALAVILVDAVLPGREITLDIDAICGKLIVIVPAGAQVIDQDGAVRQAGHLRPRKAGRC